MGSAGTFPPPIAGLPDGARESLERIVALHDVCGGRMRLGDLSSSYLHALATDPPRSDAVRVGAALAIRVLRDAAARGAPPRWPAFVDPDDDDLRRDGYRLAVLATLALTSRTGVGDPDLDPDDRRLLDIDPGDDVLIDGFVTSEREILRRKREPIPYPVDDFLDDLRELPRRLDRPEPILPPDQDPTIAGPYAFRANHDDRVVKLYDWFRDKYGSPRGERLADLYLAVLGWIGRRLDALRAAGEITVHDDGGLTFRDGFLADLLRHPLAWFEDGDDGVPPARH